MNIENFGYECQISEMPCREHLSCKHRQSRGMDCKSHAKPSFRYISIFIGVREGGAGGGCSPPNFLRIYLFGQKLSCYSGNDGLVVRRIY